MDERDVVLQVECSEPDGKVVRSVRLTRLSFARIQEIWSKCETFDVLFNDFIGKNFAAFVDHFIQQVDGEPVATGLLWDVDDVGIFFLNNIRPCESAQVHFLFWDRRFRGREELCQKMAKYVMEKFQLRRLHLEIPLYAMAAIQAAERTGFVLEGRMRDVVFYKSEWFDVNVYSMLPSDLDFKPRYSDKRATSTICANCRNKFDIIHTPRRKELSA